VRRVEAEFRPRWRPGRIVLTWLAALGVCAVLSIGAAVWNHQRVAALQAQIAQLADDERNNVRPHASRAVPAYDASARHFLKERAAGWAPMLRTLESGAMVGVTPTSVEFNATDGSARVELNYSDSTALLDYLSRINEGVSPATGGARWSLVETRTQPSAGTGNALRQGATQSADSVAIIRSAWLDSPATSVLNAAP
jgi:hypothetical protein